MKNKKSIVIYDIKAKCLDLEGFSGFFAGRKKNRLYESIMGEISCRVLDVFDSVETFTYGVTGGGFHILVWAERDSGTIAQVMAFVRSRFEERINRYLDRTGPVWDGSWSCEAIRAEDLG
ncbi:MAG TPA: hypothetical protein PLM53_10005 [Spirochaetota bacterium]|nr:hypothetical protein [Spirochaetota bacterium]HPC41084.1 hypothetical protein [Spirochaetota bacterium]HPL16980.1 hypothetical protein [Spirochaetota bacterium]HQF08803.1 hypothetical protein [Spirochaetota bacterium]HQH97422.1 hypothetical protein [Spirochaetota bacterium]